MTLYDALITPFADYGFMRRALAACLALALGGTPLGVFMTLRRMTLAGDAMSHAILPGVAAAFMAFGLAVVPLALGGLAAGIMVALAALLLTRLTRIKDDQAFALLSLVSLSAGVMMVSLRGNSVDLLHILFGNILAVDAPSLGLVVGASCLSLLTVAALYRRLILDSFDPHFLSVVSPGKSSVAALVFFALLMINLVAAFQALGTLMALGLVLLPSIAARFWTRTIDAAIPLAMAQAVASSVIGLLLSYHAALPSGPSIVLTAGLAAILSAILGPEGGALAALKNNRET